MRYPNTTSWFLYWFDRWVDNRYWRVATPDRKGEWTTRWIAMLDAKIIVEAGRKAWVEYQRRPDPPRPKEYFL